MTKSKRQEQRRDPFAIVRAVRLRELIGVLQSALETLDDAQPGSSITMHLPDRKHAEVGAAIKEALQFLYEQQESGR
jgi:hypothetical protein